MVDLEAAIKIHIENESSIRWIRPEINPIINYNAELQIKTIEQAPRDSKSRENLNTKKEAEMKTAGSDRNTTDSSL
jgi:hypothetical protein